MSFSSAAIVFNPTKNLKMVERYIELAKQRKVRTCFDVLHTENFDDIEAKADQAISTGHDIVIAAGGDGTVLGVMNAAIKRRVPFSVLPLGTGNDFARSLSIETVDDAANALCDGRVREVDAGVCTYLSPGGERREMFFCSTAGVGALAKIFSYERYLVTKVLKALLGNGVWSLLTVLSMLTSSNTDTELVLNSRTITTSMRLFEISKAPVVGGMYFTPYAGSQNGIFDAWLLHGVGSLRCLDVFLKADKTDERHFDCAGFDYFTHAGRYNRYGCAKLTEISVNPARSLPVHLNGEMLGATPCTFRILPKAISVLC